MILSLPDELLEQIVLVEPSNAIAFTLVCRRLYGCVRSIRNLTRARAIAGAIEYCGHSKYSQFIIDNIGPEDCTGHILARCARYGAIDIARLLLAKRTMCELNGRVSYFHALYVGKVAAEFHEYEFVKFWMLQPIYEIYRDYSDDIIEACIKANRVDVLEVHYHTLKAGDVCFHLGHRNIHNVAIEYLRHFCCAISNNMENIQTKSPIVQYLSGEDFAEVIAYVKDSFITCDKHFEMEPKKTNFINDMFGRVIRSDYEHAVVCGSALRVLEKFESAIRSLECGIDIVCDGNYVIHALGAVGTLEQISALADRDEIEEICDVAIMYGRTFVANNYYGQIKISSDAIVAAALVGGVPRLNDVIEASNTYNDAPDCFLNWRVMLASSLVGSVELLDWCASTWFMLDIACGEYHVEWEEMIYVARRHGWVEYIRAVEKMRELCSDPDKLCESTGTWPPSSPSPQPSDDEQ